MIHVCFSSPPCRSAEFRPGVGRWGGPFGPLGAKPRGGWGGGFALRVFGGFDCEMSSGVYVSQGENVSS